MLGKKFIQQYIDPFIILERVGQFTYQLKLPSLWNIHSVINIIYLKPVPPGKDFYGRNSIQPDPVKMNKDNLKNSASLYEIEKILIKYI